MEGRLGVVLEGFKQIWAPTWDEQSTKDPLKKGARKQGRNEGHQEAAQNRLGSVLEPEVTAKRGGPHPLEERGFPIVPWS